MRSEFSSPCNGTQKVKTGSVDNFHLASFVGWFKRGFTLDIFACFVLSYSNREFNILYIKILFNNFVSGLGVVVVVV